MVDVLPSISAKARGGVQMRLNLGAADRHIDGFLCVDIAPPPCAACDREPGLRVVDLSEYWPWADSSVDEVLALDVCEHIGDWRERDQPSGRIHFMNELHRVLVPGGRATIETPNAARGVGFWQDPTHCSPYCLSTFRYFEKGAFAHTRMSKQYGYSAAFRVIELTESRSNGENGKEEVWKIKAVLEACK